LLCGTVGAAKKGYNRSLALGHVNNSFMFKFVLLKPSLHQLIVMMKSTIIHFKQYLIAA
jgi:hypothetical protein